MKTKTGRAEASPILIWLNNAFLTLWGHYSIIRCNKTLKNEKLLRRLLEMWINILQTCHIKMAKVRKITIQSVDKDVEQLELSYITGRNLKGTRTMENQWVLS